jgi:hypothetical protein
MPKKHAPDTRRCQLEHRTRMDSRRLWKKWAMSGLTAFGLLRVQSDFTMSSLLRRLSSSREIIRRDQPSARAFAQPSDSHSRGLV